MIYFLRGLAAAKIHSTIPDSNSVAAGSGYLISDYGRLKLILNLTVYRSVYLLRLETREKVLVRISPILISLVDYGTCCGPGTWRPGTSNEETDYVPDPPPSGIALASRKQRGTAALRDN
ncbi:hypothetical protein KM043_016683 [Ampulex compressa]|nr:hypothetical protein KM043_016683 [Ampulex compressa]